MSDVKIPEEDEPQTLITVEALIQALEAAEGECPSEDLAAFREALERIVRPN